jgi:hypothetical protein
VDFSTNPPTSEGVGYGDWEEPWGQTETADMGGFSLRQTSLTGAASTSSDTRRRERETADDNERYATAVITAQNAMTRGTLIQASALIQDEELLQLARIGCARRQCDYTNLDECGGWFTISRFAFPRELQRPGFERKKCDKCSALLRETRTGKGKGGKGKGGKGKGGKGEGKGGGKGGGGRERSRSPSLCSSSASSSSSSASSSASSSSSSSRYHPAGLF